MAEFLGCLSDEVLDEFFDSMLHNNDAQFDQNEYYVTEWACIGDLTFTRSDCQVLDFTDYSISRGDETVWETRRGKDA